jgi:hypothetical protein
MDSGAQIFTVLKSVLKIILKTFLKFFSHNKTNSCFLVQLELLKN